MAAKSRGTGRRGKGRGGERKGGVLGLFSLVGQRGTVPHRISGHRYRQKQRDRQRDREREIERDRERERGGESPSVRRREYRGIELAFGEAILVGIAQTNCNERMQILRRYDWRWTGGNGRNGLADCLMFTPEIFRAGISRINEEKRENGSSAPVLHPVLHPGRPFLI